MSGWRLGGDGLEVCKCTIPCSCYFTLAPTFGDCEGTWSGTSGKADGDVGLDELNVLDIGAVWHIRDGRHTSPARLAGGQPGHQPH
jgi:hypothetical protein